MYVQFSFTHRSHTNHTPGFRETLWGWERATAEALAVSRGERGAGAREERGRARYGGFSTEEVRTGTPKRTRSVKVSEMCEISG